MERTKDRLTHVLEQAGLWDMARKARDGYYDDYETPIATPKIQLVVDLLTAGRADLADRAKAGEWDATREESDEWWKREGHKLLGLCKHGSQSYCSICG